MPIKPLLLPPRRRLHLPGLFLVACLALAGTARADWPSELVRTATAPSPGCNFYRVGGLVFDTANLPVAAWQENPTCTTNANFPYWGRRDAGGAWTVHRVYGYEPAWPDFFRGNVALAISAGGVPYLAYYSGSPGSLADGYHVINIIRVNLELQPEGPGTAAGYIAQYTNCVASDPIADLAFAGGAALPVAMLGARCDCSGGIALGYGVLVGGGFLSRADVGAQTYLTSASLASGPGGDLHVVYSGNQCGASTFLRHVAAGSGGAYQVIDGGFSGTSDYAIGPDGVHHVAGIRTTGDLVYASSLDAGATWSPLATIAGGAWDAQDPSVAVAGNGDVAVSWWAADRLHLQAMTRRGGAWSSQAVATIPVQAVGGVEAAFDADDRLAVLYFEPGALEFRLAREPGSPSPVPEARAGGVPSLGPCRPNPFNPSTTITLSLPARGAVQVDIMDAAGRSLRRLHDGVLEAGAHDLAWDGADERGQRAPSGVYFCRAATASGAALSRLVLLK